MPRGIRKTQAPKLPEGVKAATWCPVLVIPSAGHSLKADGSDLSRRQPGNSKRETEVRLRYSPCCDAHKGKITVADLESPQEMLALVNRLMNHYGHGRLLPDSAHIDWQKVVEVTPCVDCMAEYQDRQEQAAQASRVKVA